jgi:hypothetical protein
MYWCKVNVTRNSDLYVDIIIKSLGIEQPCPRICNRLYELMADEDTPLLCEYKNTSMGCQAQAQVPASLFAI